MRGIEELWERVHPRNDTRSIDELISSALTAREEQEASQAVMVLKWRGTPKVLQRVQSLCRSSLASERSLGADILGELDFPKKTFSKEILATLLAMLDCEYDSGVLQTILIALGRQKYSGLIDTALCYRNHVANSVRLGVVQALLENEDSRAINTLVELTKDVSSDVRNWATFALGTLTDLDNSELRDALADRINDSNDEARAEALIGLARRVDKRVIPALAKELSGKCVSDLAVEAAKIMANETLYSPLVALREWWDVDEELLEEAIAACSPQATEA